MHPGSIVEYVDPKTHQRASGVLDHVARMRTGFVAAFVKRDDGRVVTVAITKVRSADVAASDRIPSEVTP